MAGLVLKTSKSLKIETRVVRECLKRHGGACLGPCLLMRIVGHGCLFTDTENCVFGVDARETLTGFWLGLLSTIVVALISICSATNVVIVFAFANQQRASKVDCK